MSHQRTNRVQAAKASALNGTKSDLSTSPTGTSRRGHYYRSLSAIFSTPLRRIEQPVDFETFRSTIE